MSAQSTPAQPVSAQPHTESAVSILKRLMATAGIPSFRALCRQAGISDWAVQQVKRDRITHMRVETLQKLAAGLQLSLSELLCSFGVIECQIQSSPQPTDNSPLPINIHEHNAALAIEYQRLQNQLADQEVALRGRFQQEVLTVIEPWLLQWPTVTHAVEKNPELPATRLVPLVQPVQNLLTQWGIEAIAPVGSELPYNPQQHQLMNGNIQPGEPIKIRYTGFVQGNTLLYRAKVSPVEQGK